MNQVGIFFRHAVYDGVYSLTSERVAGGGSLNLTDSFTEWCCQESGDITGHWDTGHKLQLDFSDAMKGHKPLLSFNSQMYDLMSTYNSGKDGAIFREKDDEIKHGTLTNKNKQEKKVGES
ncbi:unnamed protein product [Meganyctiphanes norvegica]|uniref:Uncharacterized protein n=1 Tax=Meganyctiphanes norvegica TaxID=48144 RepID=A0AAV2QEX2_MEGNR